MDDDDDVELGVDVDAVLKAAQCRGTLRWRLFSVVLSWSLPA